MRALIRTPLRRRPRRRPRGGILHRAGARAVGVDRAVRAAPPVGPCVHAGRRNAVHGEGRGHPVPSPRRPVREDPRRSDRLDRDGGGRDDGCGRRPELPVQPARLHLLPLQPGWRARRAGRAVADERCRHCPHRPRRHRHRDPRHLGTALRVPDAVWSRWSALDRYRRCRQPHGAPEPHLAGRQGAARQHQRPRRAGQRPRPLRPADLHLRPPQRAGHRLQPRRQRLLHRARDGPRRRGQPPLRRLELRLGPSPALGSDVL